jgi:hypothetical protein
MRLRRTVIAGSILGLTMALGGCASKTDSASSSKSTSESTATSKSTSKAAAKTVPVLAGFSLSKIEIGMTDAEVRALLGEPANIRSYPTGKNWIPFYFGADTYRFDWIYSKTGRVIFANTNRFSRSVKVVEVIHNPEES